MASQSNQVTNVRRVNRKQAGFILTVEMVLIATILVMGVTVGMVTLRDSITAEFEDAAEAVGSLDQSYTFQGLVAGSGVVALAGSSFTDAPDIASGDLAEFDYAGLDNLEFGAELIPSGLFPGVSLGSSSSASSGDLALGVH